MDGQAEHARGAEGGDRLARLAATVFGAQDLESLVRPILALLAEAGGLDNTYLTTWDRTNNLQEWRFVHTVRGPELPEGGRWSWNEVLCDYLRLQQRHAIVDLGEEMPEHPSHTLLGVRGFISVPYDLAGRGGEIAGTLCGSTLEPLDVPDDLIELFELGARLIADQLAREIELGRERLRADVAEGRFRQRVELVATQGHMLKTSLMLVRGWTQRLLHHRHELDDAELHEVVARVNDAAERLERDLLGVLDETTTTLLGLDLRPTAVDLAATLAKEVADLDAAMPDLTIRCGPVAGRVDVDLRALEQILGHLLENAQKYTPGSTVTVTSAAIDERRVQIVVEDDGPGLPEGEDLFEPYVRGENAAGLPGTGLGMHVVRTLAEASGGSVVSGASTTGGARFEITLPAST